MPFIIIRNGYRIKNLSGGEIKFSSVWEGVKQTSTMKSYED